MLKYIKYIKMKKNKKNIYTFIEKILNEKEYKEIIKKYF